MIITSHYALRYDEDQKAIRVLSYESPICPDCGGDLSGYDTRRRHAIDSAGRSRWYLCRRLRCRSCGKLHVELPDFMEPRRHYEAGVIEEVRAGDPEQTCPADDSTIRRWKK